MRTFAPKQKAPRPTASAKSPTLASRRDGAGSDLHSITTLQGSIGNRALGQLLRQAPCSCGGSCPRCQRSRKRFSLDGDARDAPESGGQSLDPVTRAFMERRFRRDFSDVRLHTDIDAADRAAGLGARAFTVGSHVVFGAREFAPHTRSGRSLIAHELAHVAQNRSADPTSRALEPSSSRAESEAHRAGRFAGIGLPVGRLSAHHAGVALTPTSDRVVPLLSYSAGDWAVTADDERQILTALRADSDLSATIVDINSAGMLTELLERVDEPENRRDLLRLLGAGLNATARALVEPIIQDLDSNRGKIHGAQIQYNLGRLGVSGGGAAFTRSSYDDLISGDAMAPFTGSGATGVNPSDRGYTDWARSGTRMFDAHINAIDDLGGYLGTLTTSQRQRQAELLVNQPISTHYEESYAGQLPSRMQIMRAAGAANNIEGEMVAAIILAEQRDQSRVEDARDFIGGLVLGRNTSIGLGQVVPSTARTNDLFAELLTNRTSPIAHMTARGNLQPYDFVWLLASDETNIFAVARYIRIVANAGAGLSIAALPNTQAAFPGINLPAYAGNSSSWPIDNVGALGMYYTSRAWTDDTRSQGWGWFVQEAYRDVKSAALF